jgi:polysaccharide biosynthesis/export protein
MRHFFYLIITMFFLSSCGVRYKSIPYFTDLPIDSSASEQIKNNTILTIQNNDILAITVNSLNSEASAIFNMGSTSSIQGPQVATNPTNTANGFLVDQNGAIQLPLIGSVKVVGLTTFQAREILEKRLAEYLKEPVVSLRLVNFKVSVLGDVGRPGLYPVNNERVSVFEALGMAGDLNITAQRNNLLLIREDKGTRKYIRLNMQSKNLFNSPYFYLQNNDVLYAQPSKAKYASVDSSYRNISILLSALSVITLIITRL